jgi:four helix bundle protein
MKYERFEQLPVWQAAIDLAAAVYTMTKRLPFRKRYSLRDQIERAAVSVSNNIAEGFERGTNQELLTFLCVARGSAGEVRSVLCLLQKIPPFEALESEILILKSHAESISKQLGAWTRMLRNSELKGQRYVTEKTRQADHSAGDLRTQAPRHPQRRRHDARARNGPGVSRHLGARSAFVSDLLTRPAVALPRFTCTERQHLCGD